MKGVILAGGTGSRLMPLTSVVNKSILPVYDRPLIYEPIRTLREAGVTDILLVSGPEHAGQMLNLLGSGRELGVHLTYDIQEEPKGLAHGLNIAKDFADDGPVAMMLGDNIFEDSLTQAVLDVNERGKGAHVVLKEVPDPERFGVVRFGTNDAGEEVVTEIIEKPEDPPSNWIVTGFYVYDNRVFDVIGALEPSERGEYEITDVNNFYINEGTLRFTKAQGTWIDAGTFDSLLVANTFIAHRERQ